MNVINQLGAVFGTVIFYGIIAYTNNLISDINSYRIGLFTILGLLIISIIFFSLVRDVHVRYIIGERSPYKKVKYKIKRKSKKLNFFVRVLFRLQYINDKFNVLLAAIRGCGYFVMLAEFAFGISEFPWFVFVIAVAIILPALIVFVYVLELLGDVWHAERWAQFHISESRIVEDRIRWNALKNAISYRMDNENRIKKMDKLHKRLGLTQQRIRIEYEILQKLKEMREDKA
jgi:MFS family permease